MDEDNITRQADEAEALSAIYGSDWCIVDKAECIFSVNVTDESQSAERTVSLQVKFPREYPSSAPPVYEINAPYLSGMDKVKIGQQLEEIYFDNMGESVVYMWVEKVRECLHTLDSASSPDSLMPSSGPHLVLSNEVEDDIDLTVLQLALQEEAAGMEHTESVGGWQCPVIHHGEPLSDRRSTFQAHLAAISHVDQVDLVLRKLCECKKIANATHNMFAYRISTATGVHQSCDDDGEAHAGGRMLHLLQIVDALDVLVVVSRWYGGIQLGPDRFKHINNCTRSILQERGYIKDQSDKKSQSQGKKSKKR